MSEDEDVVPKEIDEIGGDEGESDRANHVHALKGAANGEIEEQGDETRREGAHVGRGEDGDRMSDAETLEIKGKNPNRDGEERSDREAEIDAV